MELLVVPPFTDFTTEFLPPPGAELLDLGARLVERLARPAHLRAAAERHSDGPHAALARRAAAAVLERETYDDTRLRAVGTALRLADDPAVRLGLDDLELAEGSTQSSRDVLGAADRCELFRPEIELAVATARGRRVHVAVDGDRQLPAAFALVKALGAERVTLCGRLVAEQVAALRRVPALAGAGWLSWSPERVIRPRWCAGHAAPVRWVTGHDQPPASGPWAGRLDAARAAAFPPDVLARCLGLTITVTRIDFLAAATGLNGLTVNLRRLLAAVPPRTPVACELAVGAPGIAAGAVVESLELLADRPGGVRVAGVRPYRMGIRTVWAGHSVRFPPRAGDDLARWVEFDAPETMRSWEVTSTIAAWLGRLPGLPPGRLAACTVAGDPPPAQTWEPCPEPITTTWPATPAPVPAPALGSLA